MVGHIDLQAARIAGDRSDRGWPVTRERNCEAPAGGLIDPRSGEAVWVLLLNCLDEGPLGGLLIYSSFGLVERQ